jgi:predicted transglutaminase-like cysteine proteinase
MVLVALGSMAFTINDILAGNLQQSRTPLSIQPGLIRVVDKWNALRLNELVDVDSPVWGIIDDAHCMEGLAQLSYVTQKLNDLIIYQNDLDDVWQSPAQTLVSGRGDCEDYAILKMWVLAQLGYAYEDMDIWVVNIRKVQTQHAVLLVKNQWVLDNRNRMVVDKTLLGPYYEDLLVIGASGFLDNRMTYG